MQVETKYWIHSDGGIYVGDKIKGAREATKEEIDKHLSENIPPDISDDINNMLPCLALISHGRKSNHSSNDNILSLNFLIKISEPNIERCTPSEYTILLSMMSLQIPLVHKASDGLIK